MKTLRVTPIAAFSDNYIWMIDDGAHAIVVDPGVAAPVIRALDERGLTLAAIMLTHLHYDHNLGVPKLLERWAVPVYGPQLNEFDRRSHPPFPKPGTVPLDCVTRVVGEGDSIALERPGMALTVLAVPGHTLGHIVFQERRRGWLFSGDTLFGGGCGKVFGGSMRAMLDSLDRLAALPPQTELYCAHEYTVANLRFALALEPSNRALASRFASDTRKRELGRPTLPSTIGLERATNPFLRVAEPELLAALRAARGIDPLTREASFAALRAWKNVF